MYVAYGNNIIDSKDVLKEIEENSEFKVLKDMSKGSKREDIIAFNLSLKVETLKEILEEDYTEEELNEDDLFEEFLTSAEEIATDLEEFLPDECIFEVRAYKWDRSDEDIRLIVAIAHEELGNNKLMDVTKRLLTQVE